MGLGDRARPAAPARGADVRARPRRVELADRALARKAPAARCFMTLTDVERRRISLRTMARDGRNGGMGDRDLLERGRGRRLARAGVCRAARAAGLVADLDGPVRLAVLLGVDAPSGGDVLEAHLRRDLATMCEAGAAHVLPSRHGLHTHLVPRIAHPTARAAVRHSGIVTAVKVASPRHWGDVPWSHRSERLAPRTTLTTWPSRTRRGGRRARSGARRRCT